MKISVAAVLSMLLAGLSLPVLAEEESRELKYEVVKKYDGFELRRYGSYLVAEIEVNSDLEGAGNKAFFALADYIGGNNVKKEEIAMTSPVNQQAAEPKGEKIAMTSPVIQQPADKKSEKIAMTSPVTQEKAKEGESTYVVSFVMPEGYTLDNIPAPLDPRVKIREVPAKLVAARTYSGTWSESNYKENEKALLDAVAKAGLTTVGDPIWARYDPPWTLWFNKRNEVMIEVKDPAAAAGAGEQK